MVAGKLFEKEHHGREYTNAIFIRVLFCALCHIQSLKSWSALWFAEDGRKREAKRRKERLLRMEFATFLQAMIAIPAQIVRSGRQTIVRLLNVNDWTATFFRLVETLRPARHVRRK